ncbi:hypothetical protein, partial [Mesobacillus zeae]|uniref:hypothetical protein n=1 Tax=Mesobacillus zeae TaxID=1917180 RepID=UPI001C70F1E0
MLQFYLDFLLAMLEFDRESAFLPEKKLVLVVCNRLYQWIFKGWSSSILRYSRLRAIYSRL